MIPGQPKRRIKIIAIAISAKGNMIAKAKEGIWN